MPTYTVHAPPGDLTRTIETADELILVKESFSFFAFAFPPLWMIVKRTWIPLLIYLAVVAAIQSIVMALELGSEFRNVSIFLLSLWFGFEANTIRRWSLNRKGWMMLSVVTGRNEEECEQKVMQWWIGTETPEVHDMTPVSKTSQGGLHEDDEVVGLFPTPAGGR